MSGVFPRDREVSHMRKIRTLSGLVAVVTSLALVDTAGAAETAFSYKASYRNVTSDPDGIWSGKDLSPLSNGTVTIYEYRLSAPQGEWWISQIWNADCSDTTCPTRLVRISGDGRTIVVDDMMRQVIPPDDPRFASISRSREQAAFAQHPFSFSQDGKTLINGDYRFQLGGAKP